MNEDRDDRHPTAEELVLHYYDESVPLGPAGTARVARHLEDCAACGDEYARLERVLGAVASLPVPDPGAGYGARVWARVQAEIEAPAPPRRLAWAAAAASLIVAAFLLGRGFAPVPVDPAAGPAASRGDARPAPRERILLVALADHLESTQMILVELANADASDGLDVSTEARRAQRLLSDSRLYRQVAGRAEEPRLVALLESLERVLVELANAPDELDAADVEALRARIEEEGLLFKVRVVGSEVRRRGPASELGAARPPDDDASTTSEA